MAEGERINGSRLTAEGAKILAGLINNLLELVGKVDARKISEWQQEIRALLDNVRTIEEKLFLKTQGGAQMAQLAFGKVRNLDETVKRSAQGLSADDATRMVEKAMEEMSQELGALFELSLSSV